MKLTLEHLKVLLLAALIIKVFFLQGSDSKPDHSGEIKALEKVSESIARERDTYRSWKDEEIRRGIERDSLLIISFTQHQKVYEPIQRNLANVPVRIQRIAGNDDSIRSAFAR